MSTKVDWARIRSGATFESLVTNLIYFLDPNASLFGRPGKDDGVDIRSGDGKTIYQAKFHDVKTAARAISSAKKEAKNLAERLKKSGVGAEIWKGAEKWVLLTNVEFNSRDKKCWEEDVVPLFAKHNIKASYWCGSRLEGELYHHVALIEAYFGDEPRALISIREARDTVRAIDFHPEALKAKFQGRQNELDELSEFLESDSENVSVVFGAGGLGKTRLVLEVVEKHVARGDGWQVLWGLNDTLSITSNWFAAIIPEKPTVLILDEPDDGRVVAAILEQINRQHGRQSQWKMIITVRSYDDPIIEKVRARRMSNDVRSIKLAPVDKASCLHFVRELIDMGKHKDEPQKWRHSAAEFITDRFNGFPAWLALAVTVLEENGDLASMPSKNEQLARRYVEQIVRLGPHGFDVNLSTVRAVALMQPVNLEDSLILEALLQRSAHETREDLLACLDHLVKCQLIFRRGARSRLLEVRPDIIKDHLLKSWLTQTLEINGNQPSATAAMREIIKEYLIAIEEHRVSPVEQTEFRTILFLEYALGYQGQKVELTRDFFVGVKDRLNDWDSHQALAAVELCADGTPIHIGSILALFESIVDVRPPPYIKETIFGDQETTYVDVLGEMASVLYDLAPLAKEAHQKERLFALMVSLLKTWSKGERKKAPPMIARTILSDKSGGYRKVAQRVAMSFLSQLKDQSPEAWLEIFDGIVNPLLSIEWLSFSRRGADIVGEQYKLPFTSPARDNVIEALYAIVDSAEATARVKKKVWTTIEAAHSEVNRRRLPLAEDKPDDEEAVEYLLASLKAVRERLSDLSIDELREARKVWDWHHRFENDARLKAIASECENKYLNTGVIGEFEELFDSRKYLLKIPQKIARELLESNASLSDFLERGLEYLGPNGDKRKLRPVAVELGKISRENPNVSEFLTESMISEDETRFLFAANIIAGRVWGTRKANDKSATSFLIEQYESIPTAHRRYLLLREVYSNWSNGAGAEEAKFILGKASVFKKAGELPWFVGVCSTLVNREGSSIRVVNECLDSLAKHDKSLNEAVKNVVESVHRTIDGETVAPELAAVLSRWVGDVIVRVKNIDNIATNISWEVEKLLARVGRPPLTWLVEVLQKREERAANNEPGFRSAPTYFRLSSLVKGVEEVDEDEAKKGVAALLTHLHETTQTSWVLPSYLHDIDPSGRFVSDAVLGVLKNIRAEEIAKIGDVAQIVSAYERNSETWRSLLIAVLEIVAGLSNVFKRRVEQCFNSGIVTSWSAPVGEVSPHFQNALNELKEIRRVELDELLQKYWDQQIEFAERDLANERERMREYNGE